MSDATQTEEWGVEIATAGGKVIPAGEGPPMTEQFARMRVHAHEPLPTTTRLLRRTKIVTYTEWEEVE